MVMRLGYLRRRWAAEVRLLHAAGASEHRREEAGELHGVTVLRKAPTHTHTLSQALSRREAVHLDD